MSSKEPAKVRLNLAGNGRSTSVGRLDPPTKGYKPSTTGRPRSITDAEAEEMVRLYRSGLTMLEVAGRVGYSKSTVRRYITLAGRSVRNTSPAEREHIELLLAQGWTPDEISRETGRSWPTIDKLRDNEMIKAASRFVAQQRRERRRGSRRNDPPHVVEAVISAARRNGNLAGTARETGYSEDKVERILLSTDLGCVVYRVWIKAGGSPHGKLVTNVTGDMVNLERVFQERFVHFTTLIEDYGLEAVKEWHDEFCEDAKALDRIIKRMQSAIDAAEADDDN